MSHAKPNVTYLCKQPSWNLPKKDGQTYCKSCRKTIPDLRDADAETIKALLERDGGETCGIFYPEQFTINAQTQHGPGVLRLVLAGALATFMAGAKLSAQSALTDSLKTEQHETGRIPAANVENGKVVESDTVPAPVAAAVKPVKQPLKYRRLQLFKVGSRNVYLNWRFPFLHVRRPFMGRFKF